MTDRLSEVCRYPTGAQTTVRSSAEIGLLSLRLSVSQGASLGDFLLNCTRMPHREGNSMGGLLYSMSGSETDEGVVKDKVFARTGDRTRGSGS